ncbi:MAG TPA: hypothetical protein VMV94_15200 [Phycisphaerae bacterium]|nr:hypothetical protein [Phycisphaerae bacterium]
MPVPAAGEVTMTHVPASLSPTALAPEPAKPVHFFAGLLLFWCRPRCYGPHMAAGSFKRALAAHVIAFIVATAIVGLVVLGIMADVSLGLRAFRAAMAETILEGAVNLAGNSWSWLPATLCLCCVPLAELGLVFLGTLVMPFGACGDRASSVWQRSVKTVYWSTTIIIPVSVILAGAILVFGRALQLTEARHILLLWPWFIAALVLWAMYLVPATILGIQRYVGPPDGPAFAAREPRCDDCGYILIGLLLNSRCPECGKPVRESLPGGRRRPGIWQQHEFKPRGFVDLIRGHWIILRGGDFFRRLPVHCGLPTARHSWWVSWALFVVGALGTLRLVWLALPDDAETQAAMTPICFFLVAAPLAFQSLMMFASCLWAQFRYGIQDYRVSAIVCYYATPLMWPLVLALFAAALLGTTPVTESLEGLSLGQIAGISVTALHIAGLTLVLAIVGALGFWWIRLLRALWSVRFANV